MQRITLMVSILMSATAASSAKPPQDDVLNTFRNVCINGATKISAVRASTIEVAGLPRNALGILQKNLVSPKMMQHLVRFNKINDDDLASKKIVKILDGAGFLILPSEDQDNKSALARLCAVIMPGDLWTDALVWAFPQVGWNHWHEPKRVDAQGKSFRYFGKSGGGWVVDVVEFDGLVSVATFPSVGSAQSKDR